MNSIPQHLQFETREAWLAERQKNIGGSEIAALFGCQADYQLSHYALWQVKSGRIPAPDVTGERPAWGLKLEAAIAEGAAEKHGWKIAKGGYVQHPTVPGLACTLDFVIASVPPGGFVGEKWGPGSLEIKNVDWLQHKRQWGDEPPLHIELQLQHQLACTGYEWGAVVCLIGGNQLAEPYYFERRPKITAEIEKRVAAFWVSVEASKEPAVDGSDTTAAAIAAMFPEHVPGTSIDVDGDNEFPGRWAALVQAKADRSAAEKTEQASKSWLMAKVGDAELIRFNGQIIATAKTQVRKAYSVKESSSRVLRIKEL